MSAECSQARHDRAVLTCGGLFACPSCSQALEDHEDQVECRRCGQRWPVIEAVPHFEAEAPYWGEIPGECMDEVNRAATKDWRDALEGSPHASVRACASRALN